MKYLETRHVRYFIAVAEELHFRRAAEQLNIAQPSLSRAISQLEHVVGVRLLNRTNRKVELTAAGEIFFRSCRQTLESLEIAALQARKAELGEFGNLTIAHTDFAISGLLPDILQQFRKQVPDAIIEMQHMFTDQQLEALATGVIDFGFLTGTVGDPALSRITVQRDGFVVILPEAHPLASLDVVPLAALRDQPFVAGAKRSWSHYMENLTRLCRTEGFEPRVVQEAFNSESIFGLVAANIGIAIHPACARNYIRKGIVIRDLDAENAHISTDCVWSSGSVTPIMLKFINLVRERFDNSVAAPECGRTNPAVGA